MKNLFSYIMNNRVLCIILILSLIMNFLIKMNDI